MSENIEALESEHRDPSPATPGHSEPRPDSANGAEEDPRDVEKTLASSIPLLSTLDYRQAGRGSSLIFVCKWALVAFAPIISVAYLAFCYVVHYRVVPANVSGLRTDTTQVLADLGAGITSVNIVIISVILFPIRSLICDLQSEEFFRLLFSRRNTHGAELNVVNGISTPSYSLVESITTIVHQHCSVYYVASFIAAVLIWAFSTLAPAALSVQPILVDGAVTAFRVGAIPPLSLYQPVAGGQIREPSVFSPAPGYSAAIVWAEQEIGLSYSFSVSNDPQGTYSGFAVPTPTIPNSTVNARWLTDVIGFNPYCTWGNPANLTATSLNVTMNSTQVPTDALSVHLEGLDLEVTVPSSYFPVYDSFFVTSINVHDPTVTVFNYTTRSLPTDGAMVMSVVQCASTNCTVDAINIVSLFVNFTDVPSVSFSSVGAEYEIGFLVCKPNITIETREVRTQGSMTLGVQPLADGAPPYSRQGNLDWTQTSLLAAYSLSGLTTDSGPASSSRRGLGSETQVNFMFGSEQMSRVPSGDAYENMSMVITPLPLDQLTKAYTQMVTASMKPYVSGSLGTSFVPGRVASTRQIFVSSLKHVIASTVLLAVLFVMAVIAYFRRGKGVQFNLTNIAAALAGSELPEVAKKVKVDVMADTEQNREQRRRWLKEDVGQEVSRVLGSWKVSLELPAKADGLEMLHISKEQGQAGDKACQGRSDVETLT